MTTCIYVRKKIKEIEIKMRWSGIYFGEVLLTSISLRETRPISSFPKRGSLRSRDVSTSNGGVFRKTIKKIDDYFDKENITTEQRRFFI